MSGSLSALLRSLHEAHQRIKMLSQEMDESQRAVARLQTQLQDRENQVRQLQEEIRQLKVTLHDREVTEKQLHEKLTRWQRQLQAASTAKEYQALQTQIENARIQLSALEDEMLDLIDKLEFTVGDATMGQTYQATSTSVRVNILVRDPQGPNNGPPGLNMPLLDHIDLIAGRVTGLIDPSDPQYHVATNPTTRVIARFDAVGGIVDSNGLISTAWMDLGNGERMMSLTLNDVEENMYFRLRGTNLGLNVSGETDAAGNPLGDWLSSYHIAGDHEAEAWADLWLYSNPVFVAAVPEPGTLSMLALAGLALLRRRRMA